MEKFELTPLSDIVDEVWGPIGTPERDAMEAKLKEELDAYHLGEAIKEARIKQHLTQDELGALIGVQRAQICKIERGRHSLTLSTMGKVFRALGFDKATLDLGGGVRLALW